MKYLIIRNINILCRNIIFFSLLLSYPFFGNSQQFPSKFLSLEDGLPQSLYRVVQDEQGYMWILCEDGMARYDGSEVNFLGIKDGLPDNDIFNFIPDKQGRNWLLNNNDYFAYQRGDSIKIFDIPRNGRLHVIKKDSAYVEIVSNNNSKVLRIYSDDSYEEEDYFQYLHKFLNPNVSIDTSLNYEDLLKEDSIGNYFTYYDTYYKHLELDLLLKYYQKSESFEHFVKVLLVDPMLLSKLNQPVFQACIYDKTLQFFTESYHLVFDEEFNLISSLRVENPKNKLIKTVLKDKNGDYWLISKDGIYIVDKNYINNNIQWLPLTQNINVLDIIQYKDQYILQSSDNNIYSYTKALDNSYNFSTIYERPTAKSDQNLKHLQLIENELFYVYSKRQLNSSTLSPVNSSPLRIKEAKEIISSYVGSFKRLSYQDSVIYFSKSLLAGKIDLKTLKSDILYSGESTQISHSFGKTYIYSLDSLYIYIKDNFHMKQQFQGIRNVVGISESYYLVVNKQNQTFLCNDKTCEKINYLDGKNVNDLLYAEGNHWFVYEKGILKSKFSPSTGFTFYKDFRLAEILKVNQINDLLINDSIATIATDKGLFEFNHKSFNLSQDVFPVYIEKIVTPNQTIGYNSEITLPYDERNLTIHCSGLSFKDSKPIQFNYLMKGTGEELNSTTNKQIRYTNINPGKYEFEVYAINELGSISDTQTFTLRIKKPWWQTWIFYILCLAILLFGLYYLSKRRINKIKEKSRIEQKFAELELNALQSQMNPHFIFNAMSSMQNLIQQKDFVKSDLYLAKFSKLMRMYLESSKQKYISIQDELDIIELYFLLEKLRFQDKIEIEIENKLSQEILQTKIPSSLIQPFVENSINHGLFHKKGPGKIILRLYKKTDTVVIEIEDNGVGRVKSQEINRGIFKPMSRALGIIDDKIKAIKKMDNYSLDYEIIDLYDQLKNAKGTKVVIQINV